MSVSRFTAALMAGTQESTLALAALNFDFSLFKVEAPKEYQALGSCLSEERRREAEEGPQHMTARKLGAIFRSRLPKVPNLLNAFGERVSEIAKQTTTNDQSPSGALNNPFAHKMGIDGTSIWAAATSGTEALCAQLLACLLARFWAADEATSIWAEILEARKLELLDRQGDYDFPEIAAIQGTVSREQLAEWDASARAWLRTADSLNSKRQTQLRLIIENIDVDVNRKNDTYESVMEAWMESMKVADNLVAGVPQSVYNGAALVGLSAWHLFPDMMVYTGACKEIVQGDRLVKCGGLLTLGLEAGPEFEAGVRWSLPLAKLRHYGDPVVVEKTFDLGKSRVSVNELMMIALGCLAREWPEMSDKCTSVCRYYESLGKALKLHLDKDGTPTWVEFVSDAASRFLKAEGEDKKILKRLMEFGIRRGNDFLGKKEMNQAINWDQQMLGMTDLDGFIVQLSRPELQVAYLREAMAEVAKNPEDWIIAYEATGHRFGDEVIFGERYDDETFGERYAFATVLPFTDSKGAQKQHCTWNRGSFSKPAVADTRANSTAEKILPLDGWTYGFQDEKLFGRDAKNNILCFRGRVKEDEKDEFALRFNPVSTERNMGHEVRFELYFGNPEFCAVYRRRQKFGMKKLGNSAIDREMDIEEIISVISMGEVDLQLIPLSEGWQPLHALGLLAQLYTNLGSASISMDVINSKLTSKQWFKASEPATKWYGVAKHTHATAFSCIANMETGDQDLNPEMLQQVMALSAGDSIFAVPALLSDPYTDPSCTAIVRTFGNVGKYGISLLIPPPEPKVRKPESGEWNVINHETWDGESADCFTHTSLHLSLTDYRVPYTTSHRGNRDIQAFFQEAVISVYDGDTWVGDIDIAKTVKSNPITFVRVMRECKHGMKDKFEAFPALSRQQKKKQRKKKQRAVLAYEIVCVDNWYELLDKPDRPVIVRSQKNWLGRLATASMAAQLGYRVLVLPEDGCSKGCFSNVEFMRDHMAQGKEVIIA